MELVVAQPLRAMLIRRYDNQAMAQFAHMGRIIIMKTLVNQTVRFADARPVEVLMLDKLRLILPNRVSAIWSIHCLCSLRLRCVQG